MCNKALETNIPAHLSPEILFHSWCSLLISLSTEECDPNKLFFGLYFNWNTVVSSESVGLTVLTISDTIEHLIL